MSRCDERLKARVDESTCSVWMVNFSFFFFPLFFLTLFPPRFCSFIGGPARLLTQDHPVPCETPGAGPSAKITPALLSHSPVAALPSADTLRLAPAVAALLNASGSEDSHRDPDQQA
jgi:hypothetical protein